MRTWIWKILFNNSEFYNSPSIVLIVHIIKSVLIVYVACTLIEYFRKRFVEKPLIGILNPLFDRASKIFNKLMEKLFHFC